MRILLTHNPSAGYGGHEQSSLQAAIETAGHSVKVQSAKQQLADISGAETDLVVVAGGDGAVCSVALQLRGTGVPIAVLPLGTANNIANHLGCTESIADLIQSWIRATPTDIDLGRVRGPVAEQLFIESFGIGLIGTAIAADAAAAAQRQTERAKRASKREGSPGAGPANERVRESLTRLRDSVPTARPIQARLTLDGHIWTGHYLLIEAMNIACIGPRLCLAPGADPTDGMVDVAILNADDRDAFRAHLAALVDGAQPPDTGGIVVHRVRHFRLSWDGTAAHTDGHAKPETEFVTQGAHGDLAAEVEVVAESGQVRVLTRNASPQG